MISYTTFHRGNVFYSIWELFCYLEALLALFREIGTSSFFTAEHPNPHEMKQGKSFQIAELVPAR